MNLFFAGASGAIGRQLVPMLLAAGHRVVALTRTADGMAQLARLGAEPVQGDVFDAAGLAARVRQAAPEVVIHQLTAFGATQGDPLAETIRVRTEGTRNLVAAARQAGTRRMITQSISFICTPLAAGRLTDEDTPLYLDAPAAIRPLAQAVDEMERRTLEAEGIDGVVLRYGWFYGPGTNFDADTGSIPRAIRKGRMPLVGDGAGTYSFIHVRDAAAATLQALHVPAPPGVYNIVDDEPARLSEWLPAAAGLLGAPPPPRMDVVTAREKLGDMLVYIHDEQSGATAGKAKAAFAFRPSLPSWRQGFEAMFRAAPHDSQVQSRQEPNERAGL